MYIKRGINSGISENRKQIGNMAEKVQKLNMADLS